MKTKIYSSLLSLGIIAGGLLGCAELDVENENNPQLVDVYDDVTEFVEIIDGSFLSLWQATELNEPHWPLSVTAQVMTTSYGNWGGWDFGRIPREPLQNNLNYTYRGVMEIPWDRLNAAIANVNTPMRILNETGQTVVIDSVDRTAEIYAKGKAIQGLALGYVSLMFDQGYIVDDEIDLATVTLHPYNEVMDFALGKLDEAIALSNSNSFMVNGWNGLSYTSAEFATLLRSFRIKFMAYRSRNAAETPNMDWAGILALTNQGYITNDFAPVGDANFWWTRIKIQGQDPGWARVSQRIINMMQPDQVYPWPDGVNNFPEIEDPIDDRITTDFQYAGTPPFPAARGFYFFGSYRYSRYQAYRATLTEPMEHTTVPEIDLIRAEALVRTGGSKLEAAQLINRTRVNRGGLTPLTGVESDADLLRAITYERLVEFGWTGAGNGYFARRMATSPDLLPEPGTIPHMPIPARELNILGLPIYTTGGTGGEG